MTVLSAQAIVGMALPAIAPSSAPAGGSNIGTYAGTDWQYARDAGKAKTAKELKAAIAKAREKAEAKYETKQQRLERSAGVRDTGSLRERRATRDTVAKAAEQLAGATMQGEVNTDLFRHVCEVLRQRYPGRKLSAMLETAQRQEAMFMDDPVAAREALISQYAKMPGENLPIYRAPGYSNGLRGSLQRARQDSEDLEDLREWVAKFGRHLPTILHQIETFDRGMFNDPGAMSAKLAAAYGAPAVAGEIPAYQARMAAKHLQQSRERGVLLAIQHGLIDGNEAHLDVIADVLKHPDFPWAQHYAQHGAHAELFALRHAHEVALQLRKSAKSGEKRSTAASKSISGAPVPGQGDPNRNKGKGGIRDSIARVQAAM